MKLLKFISATLSAAIVALVFSAIHAHPAVDRVCNYTVGSTTTATGFANCTEEIGDLATKAFAIAATVSGTNDIEVTSTPVVTTLVDGQMAVFTAANTITGAATFKLDGTTARSLYQLDGVTALGSGDIVAGVRYILSYKASNTRWLLMGATGTGAAPVAIPYLTIGNTSSLVLERAIAPDGTTITGTDGGANGSYGLSITTNGIGNSQLRQGTATSIIGRSANSTGNVADIAASADGQYLRRSASALSFGVPTATEITNTPAGNIAATKVQAAITELDNEKQPLDTDLTCYAGLTSAANKIPYFTGLGTCATTDFSVAIRTIITTPSSANMAAWMSDETGTNKLVFSNNPVLVTPNLGTPSAVNLANGTALPISGISGLGSGVGTALGVATNANGGFPLQSGTPTGGNCVRWKVGGGVEDSGGTCGGGGSGSPGGSSGQIQWNDGGAFNGFTTSGDATINTTTGAVTIASNAVTYAKMQDVTANSVLARAAATDGDTSAVALSASQLLGRGSTGDVAAISLGNGFSMSGTTLSSGPAFFANFSSLEVAGTYSRTGTTVTVTYTGHDLEAGAKVLLDYTTGTATDGTYDVTIVDANTFTVTDPSSGSTSGNVTLKLRIFRSTNISSITDNGAGDFTLNFATTLASKRYAMSFMGVPYSSTNMTGLTNIGLYPTGAGSFIPATKTTSAVRILVGNPSSSAVGDAGDISVMGFL